MANVRFSVGARAYSATDVRNTMCIGDLIDFLEGCDPDARIILEFPQPVGYSLYGGLQAQDIYEDEEDEDDEEE